MTEYKRFIAAGVFGCIFGLSVWGINETDSYIVTFLLFCVAMAMGVFASMALIEAFDL